MDQRVVVLSQPAIKYLLDLLDVDEGEHADPAVVAEVFGALIVESEPTLD